MEYCGSRTVSKYIRYRYKSRALQEYKAGIPESYPKLDPIEAKPLIR